MLLDDLAAADRAAVLVAVRVVRAVLLLAAVLRVVAGALRAAAAGARFAGLALPARVAAVDRVPRSLVADFVERAGVLRAAGLAFALVLPVRLAAARGAAARVVAVRAVVRLGAARFAAGAALARVVFFAGAFAAAVLVVRLADARVVLAAALVDDPFAADDVFGAAFDFAAGFFAADEAAPVRVVRAAALRALVPAVRRPPARTAIARVRPPSVVVSLLMIRILCSILKLLGREATA